MEEFFGELGNLPNETDGSDGKAPSDDEGIASLAKLAARGTVAEINWTDEKDKNGAVLALAAFLAGAGRNQYAHFISCMSLHSFHSCHCIHKKGRKCALAHTARTVRGDIDQRKVES